MSKSSKKKWVYVPRGQHTSSAKFGGVEASGEDNSKPIKTDAIWRPKARSEVSQVLSGLVSPHTENDTRASSKAGPSSSSNASNAFGRHEVEKMGLPAICQRTSIRNDSAESTADMAADPSAALNFFGRHGGEIECTFPFSEIEQAWPNTDNTVASESEKAWPTTDNTVASESEKAWPNAHNTLASVSENAWPNTYHTVASESEKAWPNAHNTLVSESENSWSNAFNTGQMQYEVLNRVEPSERTFTTDVLAYGRNISVTITSEAAVAQQWLESRDGKMYGMDLEWKPNRYTDEDNKVALLQLCSDKECLMLQMLFLDLMPQGLVNFLLDAERKIAGVGIKEDTKKLRRDYGLQSNGVVELTVLAVQKIGKPKCKKMGLKSLLKEVTGLLIEKPKRITMSDWAQPSLDRHQIKYACIDAWASYAIYEKLMTYNWAVSRQAN